MKAPFVKNFEKSAAQDINEHEDLRKAALLENNEAKIENNVSDIKRTKIDIGDEILDDNGNDINQGDLLSPNNRFTLNEIEYETDDNGKIYKIDGKLNPDCEYIINGFTYKTDSNGRIISWNGKPRYNPEAERDAGAQIEAGGKDRLDGDDGGHLEARILDGSSGNENIVPMRDTINRGDYKRAENEIADAKNPDTGEGVQDVQDSGKIIYEGDSTRPSRIERTYSIDGEKREIKVDNVEGSQNLLEDVKGDISEEDYEGLTDRINDMEEDGLEVSITSVYKKYDAGGNPNSVTVGLRDETNGNKTYITYELK